MIKMASLVDVRRIWLAQVIQTDDAWRPVAFSKNPSSLWRITIKSGFIAATVSKVSKKLSFFFKDDDPASKFRGLIPNRWAAISKDSLVRVEASKNKLATTSFRNEQSKSGLWS